jgi:putative oxidoreductase
MKKLIFSHQFLWANAIFLLRVWIGVIFIHYGLSVLHYRSMIDFADTLKNINIPFPLLSAYLCKSTEFFGGIGLILGFLKRPFCLLLIIDMIVATFIFHRGFLLQNGMTTFLLLICCVTILLSPTDTLSIDWYIGKKLK